MLNTWEIAPIHQTNKKQFLSFLNKDRILHIFTIYDLKFMREKTRLWVARKDADISGYLFEFDKRIVHTHGTMESVSKLLDYIDLNEPVLVIEPHHLAVIKKSYEPVEPTDPTSKGKITRYLVMKANAKAFKPLIRHRVKKLERQDLGEVLENFGEDWKRRIEDAMSRGLAFGAYKDGMLASVATVPEIIDDIAFIRGVYTVPSLRSSGFATSACSALVKDVISLGKDAALWVATDNLPARNIYEKIGFQKTGHILLGFKARRLKK